MLFNRSRWRRARDGNSRIKKTKGKDKKVVRIIEEMKKAEVKVLRGDEWELKNDLHLFSINISEIKE